MEKLKPFIAIGVLILLAFSVMGLYNYNKLQKEIKTSCGYERQDKVFCVCDKSIVSNIYTYNNPYFNHSLSNFLNLSEIEGKS
jgi:hypothetical protein